MKRVIRNRVKTAQNFDRSGKASRVNLTNFAHELAQDINQVMDTMLTSADGAEVENNVSYSHEELMADLETGATAEASFNHSVQFDLSDRSDGPPNLQEDLDASEDF